MTRMTFGVAAVLLGAGYAQGALVLTLGNTYTGTAPAGSAPWATATFTQNGTNMVRLTLQSNLSGTEFLSNVLFNLDPAQSGVSGALNSGLSMGVFAAPDIDIGQNQYSAGGGAQYDIRLAFATAPPGMRFGGTDKAVIDFTGTGLTESDFNFFAVPGGGGLTFRAAAHVQGIGPSGSDSGWIGDGPIIPLPPAAYPGAACLLGVAGVSLARRRMRN